MQYTKENKEINKERAKKLFQQGLVGVIDGKYCQLCQGPRELSLSSP